MLADFDEMSSRDLERHIEVNLLGSIWTARAAWPHMRGAGYGRIVNTASGAMAGLGRLSAYSISKGGVFSLTRSLAVDGAQHGIKANTINPAAYTRMLEAQQEEDSSLLQASKAHMAAELVSPAVALMSHESCPFSGECIEAGGGHVSRLYLAQTSGFTDPSLTIESLLERWPEIMDVSQARSLDAGFIDVSQWNVKPYAK